MADDLQEQVDAIERLKKAQRDCEWAEAKWKEAVVEAKAAGVAQQRILKITGITDENAILEMLQELGRKSD